MSLLQRLQAFDAYTKPLEDFRIKTLSGGAGTFVLIITSVELISHF
jgi:hypothetical protein